MNTPFEQPTPRLVTNSLLWFFASQFEEQRQRLVEYEAQCAATKCQAHVDHPIVELAEGLSRLAARRAYELNDVSDLALGMEELSCLLDLIVEIEAHERASLSALQNHASWRLVRKLSASVMRHENWPDGAKLSVWEMLSMVSD